MALFKRGTTWWVSFTTPGGERVRRSAGTSDKTLALQYHDQLKHEAWRIHMLGEKPRRTWQEAVVRWLADTKEKADHSKDIGKLKWLDEHLGDKHLDQIDRDLIDRIGRLKRDESSPSTANRYLALIRAILRMARDEWDWIDRVPRFRLYREPQKRVRWLKPKEAERLLAELPPHLKAMAAFSLATGLRQRNVSYLRWDQVDLERGMAWIHADQSKSRKAFAVPLNEDACGVLIGQQGQHPEYCFTYQGEPVERTSTKAWARALERAGITDFRWHDLRHTWASWHVQNGTSLYELMELGGWSSFDMVLRYAHMAGEHLKAAAGHVVWRDKYFT
ncbi:tyrosine-type recombinase/integrase [Marinobacterium litorale]|uniref:tyrosine-type recombinase/integrase n=1 Tax=Marinobacterium litorale TaxID=404770 RepID=UPI00040695AF|nr:site-specific integrase [Marinobacterium litorale]